mmetsp:Transcript_39589/g.96272  ORF Transcript_39589/g.96272 Transcript_39589/m.96272 type:complete len:97 (-) Transcript_39589:123-413(-)
MLLRLAVRGVSRPAQQQTPERTHSHTCCQDGNEVIQEVAPARTLSDGERAQAKVPWIGSLYQHELGIEVVDAKGNVYFGKPPPPGKPPRQFRPTLR